MLDAVPDTPAARPLTFTEEARRRQIVECTIELMSEAGYAGTSLAAIAARAGISKAAVLYHFTSKEKVVAATFAHVIDGYVSAVGERVDAASDNTGMLVGYLRGTIEHLREHPAHVRVLVEGLSRTGMREEGASQRWQAVAGILDDGRRAGEFRTFDTRVMALAIGGALDGVVAEWLRDPTLDLAAGAAELETAILLAVRSAPTESSATESTPTKRKAKP